MKPRIATLIDYVGVALITGGVICVLAGFVSNGLESFGLFEAGAGSIASAFFAFGFSLIVAKVCEIEDHLKPNAERLPVERAGTLGL